MPHPPLPPQPALVDTPPGAIAPVTSPAFALTSASTQQSQGIPAIANVELAPEQDSVPEFAAATRPTISELSPLPTVTTEAEPLGQPLRPRDSSPLPSPVLRVQTRDGQRQDFDLTPREIPIEVIPPPATVSPRPDRPGVEAEDIEAASETVPVAPAIPPQTQDILEVTADRQEYDERRQIVTATGNAVVRFARGVFTADRVRINLRNRMMVGNGNAAMRRGQQIFRGETFEYQLTQDEGKIYQASGQIDQTTAGPDLEIRSPSAETAANLPERPVSDRINAQQPVTGFSPSGDGFNFTLGSSFVASGFGNATSGSGGEVRRMRYEADYVEFDSQGWQAQNVRFTNDPFSPPELEIRAETATFTRKSPLVDVLDLERSRLVLDQTTKLPFLNRFVFDRRPQRAGLFTIAFDDSERGGMYLERTYTLVGNSKVLWTISPQYLLQRAVFEEGPFDLASLGVRSNLDVNFDPRTALVGNASLPSLDLTQIEDKLRASVRLKRAIGDLAKPHILTGEYSYRDRLFNGSLGFQTVQSSLGLVLASPNYVLGDSGVNLRYQGAVQVITANTDRDELLDPNRENDRVTLTRIQGATAINKGFRLWNGTTLPPTPTEGLRYTSRPVQPYIQLNTGLSGVTSQYSNGDSQDTIGGSIGLQGQFGHFSKPIFDYTAFNITYSQTAFSDQSPFLFDRVADSRALSFGITQQIYGPFRFGFQSAVNLNTGNNISTRYTLEYSRRTYSIQLQYYPEQNLGSFLIRIGDFNWSGSDGPFSGTGVRPVVQGVSE